MTRAGSQAARRGRGGIPATVTLALALTACDRGAPPAASKALPPGVVARVGTIEISAEHVGGIAAAQHVSPTEARDRAVYDALLAREAEVRGLDRSPGVTQQIEAELARRLLRRLLADARAKPPTEDELREAAARKWLDVDRPEGFRTVHAVVLSDPQKDDPAKRARARAVADAIRAAVLPIAERAATMPLAEGAPLPTARQIPADDPDPLSGAFRKEATAVPRDGFDVTVEPLPAIAVDGRVLAPGGERFDTGFAAAASALAARGALSPVVESPFGYHVILLLERSPAQILTGEARTKRLFDDIVNDRARAAEKRLLTSLRPRGGASPDAPGLLDLVSVEP
ncbi:MAG: peptidyl-prolyl cis-trans isomerase [Minicystis sp.]